MYIFIRNSLSGHLNNDILVRSGEANNLSGNHTLVKIIAKLWDTVIVLTSRFPGWSSFGSPGVPFSLLISEPDPHFSPIP